MTKKQQTKEIETKHIEKTKKRKKKGEKITLLSLINLPLNSSTPKE
jgi:hypothetical protein